MKNYAISDIHGCLKTFKVLLKDIDFSKADTLYLLGDYIDRGADSKGVIDYILAMQEDGYKVHCLRGNHEQMMLEALEGDNKDKRLWLYNGGEETLQSFGVDNVEQVPSKYIDFLNNLDYFFEVDDYILTHAGLNFDIPNPFEGLFSMLWIRDWYRDINFDWLGNRVIVHGHTPLPINVLENRFEKFPIVQFLDIDGGCVFRDRRPDMGYLCAFDMTEGELISLRSRE